MYCLLIESYTPLNVGLKLGLAGTQIVFQALIHDEIQLYPEYTGTGLHVLLDPSPRTIDSLGNDPKAVFSYGRKQTRRGVGLLWLKHSGLEKSYAPLA